MQATMSRRMKIAVYSALSLAFVSLIIYLTMLYGPKIRELSRKPEELMGLLNSYGWKGVLVFIGIQMLQVVVAFIPGELVQIAGGYIYGAWLGTLYSLIGIVAGSVIVFSIARLLGYPLVRLLVPASYLEKFSFIINSKKSEAAMFLLFLIPGIPKDVVTYIAGVTPVKPLTFFTIITIGRFPALLASSFIGSNTQKGNYGIAIILSVAALILFIAGLLLKDKIIEKISRFT